MANEDPEPKSGQLIRPEPPLPLTARTGQQRTIDWLLSRISRWPFSNRAYLRSLKTAQQVIGERTKLEETIIGHGKTRAKLNDLETIVAQDKLQRRRELLEEQRRLSAVLNETMLDGEMVDAKNKLQREELKIKEMELAKRKAILKKELDELNKPPPPPPRSRQRKRLAGGHRNRKPVTMHRKAMKKRLRGSERIRSCLRKQKRI